MLYKRELFGQILYLLTRQKMSFRDTLKLKIEELRARFALLSRRVVEYGNYNLTDDK